MNLTKIRTSYQSLGWANSSSFTYPSGDGWYRAFVSASGNLEVYVNDETQQYYQKDCG